MRRPRYKVGDFVVSTYHQNMSLMYVIRTEHLPNRHGDKKQDTHLVFCNVMDSSRSDDFKLTVDFRNEWWEVRRATEQEIIKMRKLSQDGSI